MKRSIDLTIAARPAIDDGDLLLYRALPAPRRDAVGPFVFLDHYRTQSLRGLGDSAHPHAGIEVLSYLLEGSLEHRDSMGFRDRLGPGDAQWIRAGRGMLHAEQPLSGRHGLQLWTSLPATQRFDAPAYASWRSTDLPLIQQQGATVRVVAGPVGGVEGVAAFATPTTFAHIRLQPGASVALEVDPDAELGAYVIDGAMAGADGRVLPVGSLSILTPGNSVLLASTAERAADIALLGGRPAERPILFSGPFVMGTRQELLRARHDFASGAMGRLDGVPF